MRLLLAAAVLVTIAVPLANAHIVVCTFDEAAQRCVVTTIDAPVHATVFEPPCFCIHTEPSLAMERFLP